MRPPAPPPTEVMALGQEYGRRTTPDDGAADHEEFTTDAASAGTPHRTDAPSRGPLPAAGWPRHRALIAPQKPTAPDGPEPLRSLLLAGRREVLALEDFDSSPIFLGEIVNSLREPVMVRGTTRGVVELALSRSPLRENHHGAGSILNLHWGALNRSGLCALRVVHKWCARTTNTGPRVRRDTLHDSVREEEGRTPRRDAVPDPTGPWFASSGCVPDQDVGSGGRIRTTDQGLMSPLLYH